MNDLISRQAAIDALGEAPKYKPRIIKTYAEWRNDQWFDDVAKLTLLPSAQVEWKRGKWIQNDNDTWSCDQCQSWIPNEQHHYARFCLYCGARMDEVKL